MENTILGGFGEIDENTEEDLKKLAKKHNVKFYPTYYDWSMEGKKADIEVITKAYWGMFIDEWEDNGLSIIKY